MSDDWFDKTYRSEGTPPADLDARILKRARRATRRWAGSLVAAGIVTVAVALILAIVVTNIELDVPPTERSTPRDVESPAPADADCVRSLELVGPFGGPGRRDRAEICLTADLLRAEFSWDGEESCPSRLEVAASVDTPVLLEDGGLVIGSTSYGCADGKWERR